MTRRLYLCVTVYLSRYTVKTVVWISYKYYRTFIDLTRLLQRKKDWQLFEKGKIFAHATQIDILRVRHFTGSSRGRINLNTYKKLFVIVYVIEKIEEN